MPMFFWIGDFVVWLLSYNVVYPTIGRAFLKIVTLGTFPNDEQAGRLRRLMLIIGMTISACGLIGAVKLLRLIL